MANNRYKVVKDPLTKAKYISDVLLGVIYLDIAPEIKQIKNSRQYATRAIWNQYIALINVDKQKAINFLNNKKVRKYRKKTDIILYGLSFLLIFTIVLSILYFVTQEREHVYITNNDTTIVKEPPFLNKNYIDSLYNLVVKKSKPLNKKFDEKIDSLTKKWFSNDKN